MDGVRNSLTAVSRVACRVEVLRECADKVVENARRHVASKRTATFVDPIDPKAEWRRIDMPTEEPPDTRFYFRLEVWSSISIERKSRLYRFSLRPTAGHPL